MIQTEANKTQFGKRDKRYPYRATLNGTTEIALGESVTDAKMRAQTILEDTYVAAQAPMVSRIAKDGTVFVARWTGHASMEYVIVRKGQYHHSAVMGQCDTSLQRYMDKVVADYDACTAEVTQ